MINAVFLLVIGMFVKRTLLFEKSKCVFVNCLLTLSSSERIYVDLWLSAYQGIEFI